MAAVTRQPFAPLDGSRLQTLTSLKNRQNAVSSPANKRKVETVDDDAENVDPLFFAKRSKGSNGSFISSKDGSFFKPSNYLLTTKKPAITTTTPVSSLNSINPTPRRMIQPKSPAAKKLNTSVATSAPLSAPAGRSPTRAGKRTGILSGRRRTAGGSYTRVDPPPAFNLGLGSLSASSSPAPFSLDAALKGTIPSYAPKRTLDDALDGDDMKASWFFDIHEDTADQEMTNMLQHGTCVLDISSDEETEQKAKRDGREDKENIAPLDDISQTRRERSRDDMVVEKERVSLGELNRTSYYAEGCDESSVIFIPADDDEAEAEAAQNQVPQPAVAQAKPAPIIQEFDFAPALKDLSPTLVPLPDLDGDFSDAETEVDVEIQVNKAAIDSLMSNESSKAPMLEPMAGTGESFELWESGSAQDDNEVAAS
jgi:hypothetical protein